MGSRPVRTLPPMKTLLSVRAWSTLPESDAALVLIETRSPGWSDVVLHDIGAGAGGTPTFMPDGDVIPWLIEWAATKAARHDHFELARERALPAEPEPDVVAAALDWHRRLAQYLIRLHGESASLRQETVAEAVAYLAARGWRRALGTAPLGASA